VYAQELLDPLLDIPPPGKSAIEKAKEWINTDQEPIQSTLGTYQEKNETGETEYILVWNITFGEPENKEVLIDAETGEVLSVRSTRKTFLQKFSWIHLYEAIVVFVFIAMCIYIVKVFIKRRKIEGDRMYEE
jgi:hypothetical protein